MDVGWLRLILVNTTSYMEILALVLCIISWTGAALCTAIVVARYSGR